MIGKIPYFNHARRHGPGGSDPIPDLFGGSGGLLPIGSSAGWQRRTVPLLSASQAWEGNAVFEPTVSYESGTWKMWYTGSYSNPGLGYAENSGDPTDPGDWVKDAGNPVLGQGGSGVAGFVSGNNVVKDGSTYYCFYYDASGGGNLKRSSSADGISWSAPSTAIANNAVSGCYGWANSFAWEESGTWYMLVEGSANATPPHGPPWAVWLFTASSITGSWTVQNGGSPLSTLEVSGYTQGYGQGPNFAQIDGVTTPQIGGSYALWCHLSASSGGLIVSNIMHARSANKTTWTTGGDFDLVADRGTYEKEQAADPYVLQVSGQSYLFYDGVDNVTGESYVNLATYDGTLESLLNHASTTGSFSFDEFIAGSTTSSTSYVDLDGPSVTIDIGSNGIALVGWAMQAGAAQMFMAVQVSGANTIAANDDRALFSVANIAFGRTAVFSGLAPGQTTFTAKYRIVTGSGTVIRRSIWALAL